MSAFVYGKIFLRTHLEEGQEVIKFLSSSAAVKEDATGLKQSCNKSDTEEIIWHIKGINTTGNWWTA